MPSRHLVSSIVLKQTWDAAKKQKPHEAAVKRVNRRRVRAKRPTCNVMLSFPRHRASQWAAVRAEFLGAGLGYFFSLTVGACVEVSRVVTARTRQAGAFAF